MRRIFSYVYVITFQRRKEFSQRLERVPFDHLSFQTRTEIAHYQNPQQSDRKANKINEIRKNFIFALEQ